MRKTLLRWGVVLAGVCWLGSQAQAQYYPPGYRPPGSTLSPYLNLVRNQNNAANPAANYFLGVIPENVNRSNAQRFGSAIQDLESAVFDPGDEYDYNPELAVTGHPTAFLNTGGYYPQGGRGRGRRQGQPGIQGQARGGSQLGNLNQGQGAGGMAPGGMAPGGGATGSGSPAPRR